MCGKKNYVPEDVLEHHNLKWQKLKQSKQIKGPIKKGNDYISTPLRLTLVTAPVKLLFKVTGDLHVAKSSLHHTCLMSAFDTVITLPLEKCSAVLASRAPLAHTRSLKKKQTQRLPPKTAGTRLYHPLPSIQVGQRSQPLHVLITGFTLSDPLSIKSD